MVLAVPNPKRWYWRGIHENLILDLAGKYILIDTLQASTASYYFALPPAGEE
jgi:hypothetical protein